MRRDPRVALSVVDLAKPYRHAAEQQVTSVAPTMKPERRGYGNAGNEVNVTGVAHLHGNGIYVKATHGSPRQRVGGVCRDGARTSGNGFSGSLHFRERCP